MAFYHLHSAWLQLKLRSLTVNPSFFTAHLYLQAVYLCLRVRYTNNTVELSLLLPIEATYFCENDVRRCRMT